MGVDVKDHRRHLQKVEDEKQAEAAQPKPLLQQVEIAKETGDPRLDKLMRAVAAEIEKCDAHAVAVALELAACIKDDMIRLKQMEFAYTKGLIQAFKTAIDMPAKILLEERGNPNISH